jgi:hypothetical protein
VSPVRPGDLVVIRLPRACPPGAIERWDGRAGFVLKEGLRGGLRVFWVHVPGVGSSSFEPGSLRELI